MPWLLALLALAETPNEFFQQGPPTFVAGTAGDDACDRAVRLQIELVRGMLFPESRVVSDDAWPERPVLYGGPHVNRLLKDVALPFRLEPGKLVIGGETLLGDEYRIIAVIPGERPFLLYAGTGTPGVAEINAIRHGPQEVLVADRFGPLFEGVILGGEVLITTRKPRLAWRWRGNVARLEVAPHRSGEPAENAAIANGLSRAAERLGMKDPPRVEVHVYPDRGSKRSLTSNGGDGHADPNSRTLHVIAAGAALADLVAHEATHVLAGPAGTPLCGEGLAVWVAGGYGGAVVPANPTLDELLTRFRKLPEGASYPIAGRLTGALIERIGLAAFLERLYPATPADWPDALKACGLESRDVEAMLR